jgi:hypothetical protein
MIMRPIPVVRFVVGGILASLVVLLVACGGGTHGGNSMPATVTVAGTAATGKALANARININCVQGSTSVSTDQSGNFSATLGAVMMPCLMTATSGATLVSSLAFAGGTFNVTAETDLLLSYMAGQLGTNHDGLVAGFATNTRFQQALANQGEVLAAQTAVGQNLQKTFGVRLTTPNFLTAPFMVGQPGVDSDLEALLAARVIDANGDPAPAAVSLMTTAGAANPIASPPTPAPGSGGTGGLGGVGGMM